MPQQFSKKHKPVILAVDDHVESLDILVDLLADYDVRDVISSQAALNLLEEQEVDLILLDIMMPDMDGFELCQKLKTNPKTRDIPVIFITAKEDDASIDKAYEVGGNDYINKPIRAKELQARVRVQLELRFTLQELSFLAYRDSLTGILNRRRFFELGKSLFAKEDKIAAVMIDVDKFKNINDCYGHALGDEVLKMVANSIASAVPQGVLFGRLGGEEFALLCENYSYEGAKTWVEFIRKQVENLSVFHKGLEVSCTISSGVADKTEDMQTLDDLLLEADKALYEAKGKGRNRTVFNIVNKSECGCDIQSHLE